MQGVPERNHESLLPKTESEDASMTPHECQEMRKLLESYKRVNFERQKRIQELIEENYELQKRIRELERRQACTGTKF